MVYSKYARNRKSPSSAPTTSGGYHPYVIASAPAVGYVAAKAAQMVANKYLNSELKFKDGTGTPTPDNVVGTLVPLNVMQLGTDHNDRIGVSIRVKSVFAQGRVNIHASAAHTVTRLALVLDRQSNGAVPSYSSAAGGGGIYENATVDSWRDIGNNQRFKVLRTVKISLDADDTEWTWFMKYRFPGRRGKVSYYPGKNVGDITDIASGAIFLVLFSDETTNKPTVEFRTRIRYLDN